MPCKEVIFPSKLNNYFLVFTLSCMPFIKHMVVTIRYSIDVITFMYKDLMEQLLKGVEAIHNNSIIHRDLKPSNILVSPEGKLKISDFGLSRPFHTGKILSTQVHLFVIVISYYHYHKTIPTILIRFFHFNTYQRSFYIAKGGNNLLSGT